MFRKLAGVTVVASLFASGAAMATVTGSVHDLSAELGITNGEVCVVCHAPHSNQNATGDLLWNHTATTTTFTPYSSASLQGTSSGPGPVSLLCLSCHDGSVAVDSYGRDAAGDPIVGTLLIDNAAFTAGVLPFGAALSDDHPIGITYEPTLDTELNATTASVTFGDTTTGDIGDMLFGAGGDVVECASCHDVHDTRSNGNTALLVVANDNSDLCTTCHSK